MADFDAGSIIGTLELDRDPFTQGLELAKEQADRFEEETKPVITPAVDTEEADTELDSLKAKSDELGAESPTITPKVDDEAAKLGLDDLLIKAEEVNHTRVKIDVQRGEVDRLISDTDRLLAEVDKIGPLAQGAFSEFAQSAQSALGSGGSGGGAAFSEGGGEFGMLGMVAGVSSLISLLIPLGAVAANAFLSLGAGFSGAAVALGSFAVVAKSDFTDMQAKLAAVKTAQQAVNDATTDPAKLAALKQLKAAQEALVGPIGEAAKAFQRLDGEWHKILHETAGPVFGVLATAFDTVRKVLPDLVPIIDATAKGLDGLIGQLSTFMQGPIVKSFFETVANTVGPALADVGTIIVNLFSALLPLINEFMPSALQLLQWFGGITQKFSEWANSIKGHQEIQAWFRYIAQVAPEVGHFLGALAGLIGQVVEKLGSPLVSGAIMQAVTMLLHDLPTLLILFQLFVLATAGAIEILSGLLVVVGWVGDIFKWVGTKIGEAAYDIYKAWGDVSAFFHRLWNDVKQWFDDGVRDVKSVGSAIGAIPSEIVKAWNGLIGFFGGLWGDIENVFSSAGTWLLNAGSSLIHGFLHGVETAWTTVSGWFSYVYAAVSNWFSGAINWLIGAGEAIIDGLWNGMKAAWNHVTGWLGSLGGIIKHLKGPMEADKVMLYDEGSAIIGGLHRGMMDTFDYTLAPSLREMAGQIANAFGGLNPNAKLSVASQVTLSEQITAAQQLAMSLDGLRSDVKALPSATGTAVGDTISDKFEKAQTAGTRVLVTTLRQG